MTFEELEQGHFFTWLDEMRTRDHLKMKTDAGYVYIADGESDGFDSLNWAQSQIMPVLVRVIVTFPDGFPPEEK